MWNCPRFGQWNPIQADFCVLSLFSGTYAQNYVPGSSDTSYNPSPGISHLCKDPWSLLVKLIFRNKDLVLDAVTIVVFCLPYSGDHWKELGLSATTISILFLVFVLNPYLYLLSSILRHLAPISISIYTHLANPTIQRKVSEFQTHTIKKISMKLTHPLKFKVSLQFFLSLDWS